MKSVGLLIFILQVGCIHSMNAPESLERYHGNEQVLSMLKDRPEMSFYRDSSGVLHEVRPDDEILKWAAGKFAGKSYGKKINWSPEVPNAKGRCSLANHSFIKDVIRVAEKDFCGTSGGVKLPFDYLWRLATFELLNIEGADEFKKVHSEVLECKLSKEEYVRKNLAIEYAALVKQINFYRDVWLPWSKEKSVHSISKYWITNIDSFDAWVNWLKNNSKPNGWVHWTFFYDNELKSIIDKKCYGQ